MNSKNKKYYLFEIDINIINIISVIIMFLMILISGWLDMNFTKEAFFKINYIKLFCYYFGYMFLHEIFHSIAYVIYGANFSKITYGIHLDKGVFCCLCKQNIDKRNILNSLMFPLFYIGIITYIVSIILNNYYLFILSIFNITGCAGDILMFLFIVKLNKNIKFTELDNPVQFAIYTDEDVFKNNHFGLKYKSCVNEVARKKLRKIEISKISYVILLFFFGLVILNLWLNN